MLEAGKVRGDDARGLGVIHFGFCVIESLAGGSEGWWSWERRELGGVVCEGQGQRVAVMLGLRV